MTPAIEKKAIRHEDVEIEVSGRIVRAEWDHTPGGVYGPGYWIMGPPVGALGPTHAANFGMVEPAGGGQWIARPWDDGGLGGGTLHASLEEAARRLAA